VLAAMRAVSEHLWDTDDLSDRTVAVQGVGKVGSNLVERLTKAGAKTIIADVNTEAVEATAAAHGSTVVAVDGIFEVQCDIFAPCAMGGAINSSTVERLRCRAIVGSANNQLESDDLADQLVDRGILYAPDFLANAGGVINIANEFRGYDWRRAAMAIDRIHENTATVLATAEAQGINPNAAAIAVAEERIARIGSIKLKTRGR
jgi:glutamate dehydrogenase/leucine dehydrogenase